MSDQPYVLARSCSEPDREFPSLSALAREIMALRYETPGRPQLRLRHAELTRSDLPGGKVIAIRLVDGLCAGHGSPLGYVFMPRGNGGHEIEALRSALDAVMEREAA